MMNVAEIQTQLTDLTDDRTLAANRKRGDNHGINLSKLRAVAKAAKTDHERAKELWATGDTGSRLVALLTCKPKDFHPDELDAMLRSTGGPKETEWLESYVIRKSPHTEELRMRWKNDPDPHVEAGAWKLLNHRIGTNPDGLDLTAILDEIEQRMSGAKPRLQWAMNEVLAQIGITQPAHRDRALAIGESLQVLADYPVSKGCISPFAPIWITEMVKRQGT